MILAGVGWRTSEGRRPESESKLKVCEQVDDLSRANRRFATKSLDLRVGPRWKYPIIEFQNRFKVVRQEWRIQIGNMRRLCGSNSGRSVGWCGYMRIPHPALPFSNLPLPFFCIIRTPPHSLSTVFSPKTGALSHRAVRGINIPDSNCIGEDRSTALRLSCPNDMPWSRPNGSSRAGQCFFLRPLLLVRGRGTLLDLGLGTLKKRTYRVRKSEICSPTRVYNPRLFTNPPTRFTKRGTGAESAWKTMIQEEGIA